MSATSNDAQIVRQISRARQELLDLGLRNPLLNYRTSKARGVEVAGGRSTDIFDLLMRQGKALGFLSVPEPAAWKTLSLIEPKVDKEVGRQLAPTKLKEAEPPELTPYNQQPNSENDEVAATGSESTQSLNLLTPYTEKVLQSRLLKTYYDAKNFIEERGANILFLALGMLVWFENDATEQPHLAPLILVPVDLDRKNVRGRFQIRYNGDDLEPNLSLDAKLKEFGAALPSFPTSDDFDVSAYFDAIRKVIEQKPGWFLAEDEVVLGFFSFGKLLMYRDLDDDAWSGAGALSTHPLITSLLGEGFRDQPSPFTDETYVDTHIDPGATHQVVDADSSQLLAVLDVASGRNLVIQGPPGTGKSQTITNLIADTLGRGQKVLFVAEKMAALEVVKRRLDDVGIGDACLELHSHNTHKKAVLAELKRVFELGRPLHRDAHSQIQLYRELRDRLNAYSEAMNSPLGAARYTPHQAIGAAIQLSKWLDEVELPPLPPENLSPDSFRATLLSWSRNDLLKNRALAKNIQTHLREMGVPTQHLFCQSQLRVLLPADKEEIRKILVRLHDTLVKLVDATRLLASTMGVTVPANYQGTENLLDLAGRLLDAPALKGVAIRSRLWVEARDRIEGLLQAGQQHQALRSRYEDVLIPEAWEQDLLETRQTLNRLARQWWRVFSGEYRRARHRLDSLCKGPGPRGADKQIELIDAVLEATRLRQNLLELEAVGRELFGAHWQGERSDWSQLGTIIHWVASLYASIAEGTIPPALINYVEVGIDRDKLQYLTQEAWSLLDNGKHYYRLATQRLDCHKEMLSPISPDSEWSTHASLVSSMLDNLDTLSQQIAFNHHASELTNAGLDWLLQIARHWPQAGTHLEALLLHAYFDALIRQAYEERAPIRYFDGGKHELDISQFRDLDRTLLKRNRIKLAFQHWENLPSSTGGGQLGVLKREFEKKARHLPIRQLMTRAGRAIQAIKPVFMMSPLSIASYLPPGSVSFDLVVFDEASQVKPVDALGAIARGKQLVVVGDSKQLPPTRFFDVMIGDGDDDGDEEVESVTADLESILGLIVSQGALQRMLRWHYRSRHESLIAVSNHEFYNDKLVIFPSPHSERDQLGLIFRYLPDTVYDRGKTRTNPLEAKAVAEAVLEHARRRPDLTLGVAAFSSAQTQAILDHLELLRRRDPTCEDFFNQHPHEPFFVKNLESVQGDERDVIFISIGYGKTAEGYVAHNFGPLNGEGGERRLNVLITRARLRCEVFTNLRHDDIDLTRTQSRGVAALKTFLKYAETGVLDVPRPTGGEADSPFEEAVRQAIESHGYQLHPQVGSGGFFIDLAVVDPEQPGRYLLGIECDGATYHRSRSARDRDRLRQQVLEGLGWRIHRIWSTDWFTYPDRELRKVLAAIEQAKAAKNTSAAVTETKPEPSGKAIDIPVQRAESNEVSASIPSVLDYRLANFSLSLENDELQQIPIAKRVEWVKEVVEYESPVHREEVARRIVEAAGIKRLGNRIQGAIDQAIETAVRNGQICRRSQWLWSPHMTTAGVRSRAKLPANMRKLDRIAPEEIEQAILLVARESYGIERDVLPVAVCEKLGFGRITEEMRNTVLAILQEAINNGIIKETADHIAAA
jgi:very-short-patch-repair endonuclease/DNA polymerase III delta prime subunit